MDLDYNDVCCFIIFIIFVIIWIARLLKAKKEKEVRRDVRPTYKPYEKTAYRKQEPTVRPEYMYKPPYQGPQAAYKPVYVQSKSENTGCKRCNSDDLKYFDSGYVKCNKCGYYYYDGSRRTEHRG
ncbi:MAG: hypothetical protein L6265_02930 [Thermoplasmatales archaeon]|nr:hypothetical protein [Thermoplasmatales archaeon]